MNRSPRLTRFQSAGAELHQSAVIALLVETAQHDIAQRLKRCWHDRQHRQAGRFPWRCGSAGCWACRRNLIRKWWLALRVWLTGATTLAVIPISGDLTTAVRRLRKGLRDVRDRKARNEFHWRGVAVAGFAGADGALVLIQHPGITRARVGAVLLRRWPDATLHDVADLAPKSWMSVADAADLARRRRGVEGLRIVVMPQRGSTSAWAEAMPFTF
jgi:heme exporter protein D